MAAHDWHALVLARARETGARDLQTQTIAELAAHLEDIYLDALANRRSEDEAVSAATAALHESTLSIVAAPRRRIPDARAWTSAPDPGSRGLHGLGGDIRFAWRQLRRAPSFASIAILTLGVG